jgi:hypothetical protein
MQNSVPGVSVGLSRMRPVIMYLHVVWITITNSTWAKGVVGPGVGRVVRSIVLSTLIRSQGQGNQMRKIITIPFVVRRRRGSSRRIIAEEDTARIVRGGGEHCRLRLDTQLSAAFHTQLSAS